MNRMRPKTLPCVTSLMIRHSADKQAMTYSYLLISVRKELIYPYQNQTAYSTAFEFINKFCMYNGIKCLGKVKLYDV